MNDQHARRKIARTVDVFPPPGGGICNTRSSTNFDPEVKELCEEAAKSGQAKAEKVIVVGDHAVGKTSLVRRFSEGKYADVYKATIGVDFIYQKYRINKQEFTLHVWDTAGQEQFRCISKAYFRGAMATILAFDVTNFQSFENTKSWISEVRQEVNPGHKVFLVGLKADLVHQVSTEMGISLAKELNAEYWEVSAKKDKNVNELFDRVAVSLFEYSLLKAEASKKSFGDTREGYKEKSFSPAPVVNPSPPPASGCCST